MQKELIICIIIVIAIIVGNTLTHNNTKNAVSEVNKKLQEVTEKILYAQGETENETGKSFTEEQKNTKSVDAEEKENTKGILEKQYIEDEITKSSELWNKEYQTQLLNAIKIPLMVYSGRIIQNYPLGLGIRAIIKTNQLVFEAASKSGSDVYNILSTGQLNGLSIALLLSIKNVYGDTKGLNILLIDDPLQTIDDISAISLADLLTQQGIGQIVLSTHEEAKAALLRYKFKHAGMSVREQNMQALYMKTVTEE